MARSLVSAQLEQQNMVDSQSATTCVGELPANSGGTTELPMSAQTAPRSIAAPAATEQPANSVYATEQSVGNHEQDENDMLAAIHALNDMTNSPVLSSSNRPKRTKTNQRGGCSARGRGKKRK